jgi:hypothetical protein
MAFTPTSCERLIDNPCHKYSCDEFGSEQKYSSLKATIEDYEIVNEVETGNPVHIVDDKLQGKFRFRFRLIYDRIFAQHHPTVVSAEVHLFTYLTPQGLYQYQRVTGGF